MPRRHTMTRDVLIVVLTLTTGAVDATSFFALGKVFSSVITGNLVLLGIAVAGGGASLAVGASIALAGYSAGVLAVARVAARPGEGRRTWPAGVTISLTVEACLLLAFSVVWEVVGGHPARDLQLALLPVLAAAMGMQSAAVRKLGQMSTTYMTGTLTGILAGLASGVRPVGLRRSVGALAALAAGAALAVTLLRTVPTLVPLAIMVPLATVIAASAAGFGGPRRRHGSGVAG